MSVIYCNCFLYSPLLLNTYFGVTGLLFDVSSCITDSVLKTLSLLLYTSDVRHWLSNLVSLLQSSLLVSCCSENWKTLYNLSVFKFPFNLPYSHTGGQK